MKRQAHLTIAVSALASIVLLACGNRPAEPTPPPAAPASSAASTPAPPAAQADSAAPPLNEQIAHAAPSAAQPAEKPAPKPAAKPAPKPTPPPAPAPKPEPIVKTVPIGTELIVELVDGASSQTSQVGNVVRARVTRAVVIDGLTVIPDGSILNGAVTEAVPIKKIGGKASLGLKFDSLEPSGGGKTAIAASIREEGKSEDGKDAGTIAGATAGGALLGRLLSKDDKTKGTLIGAVVGAAAGTGIAAGTKGQSVELPVGTTLALQIQQPVTISVEP